MKKFYFLLSMLIGLAQAIQAQTTVTLPASQDNTIYSELSNNSNGAGQNFTAGTTQRADIRRGLLRFDLSSIPLGANVTSVSLRLVVNRTVSGDHDILLHRVLQTWGEGASEAVDVASGVGVTAAAGDATWNCSFANSGGACATAWSTVGGTYNTMPSASTAVAGVGAYTWSSTQALSDVQQWVNDASVNFGWILRSAEVALGSAKRFASRTNAVLVDRPALIITYNGTVPVSFSPLQVGAIKQGALLNWKTFQETNNSFFDIEHSTDGSNFNVVGRVDGAGTSTREISYSFIHDKAQPGKNFYRLRQADFSGRTSFSNIEFVVLAAKQGTLIINPNPVTDRINLLSVGLERNPVYMIYDVKGRVLQKGNLNTRSIFLAPSLPKVMYHLRIMYADGTTLSSNFYKN